MAEDDSKHASTVSSRTLATSATESSESKGRMKRSASAGDLVWLRHQGRRLSTEFDFGDLGDTGLGDNDPAPITGLEDSFSNFGLTMASKALQKRQPAPILEEGNSQDDFSVGMSSGTNPVTDAVGSARGRKSKLLARRGSENIEKPKCSQSVMMRWLASTAVPQGSKLPPSLSGKAQGEKPCKDFAFAFKSRDLNAVTPSNW